MLYYIFLFLIFYTMDILVLGFGQMKEPFYSALSIAIPFENNAVIFSRLVLNYGIIMIFIFNIINNLKQLFGVSSYILPRCKRGQMFRLFLGRTIKKTAYILVIKLLADLSAGQVNGLENVDILLKSYLSSILTLIIWILLILIMYTINIGEMKTIFIILFLTYICQYLSLSIDILNVFVIASPGIVDNFPLWILIKLSTSILLILVSYNLFRNKEFIGGVKDD